MLTAAATIRTTGTHQVSRAGPCRAWPGPSSPPGSGRSAVAGWSASAEARPRTWVSPAIPSSTRMPRTTPAAISGRPSREAACHDRAPELAATVPQPVTARSVPIPAAMEASLVRAQARRVPAPGRHRQAQHRGEQPAQPGWDDHDGGRRALGHRTVRAACGVPVHRHRAGQPVPPEQVRRHRQHHDDQADGHRRRSRQVQPGPAAAPARRRPGHAGHAGHRWLRTRSWISGSDSPRSRAASMRRRAWSASPARAGWPSTVTPRPRRTSTSCSSRSSA